MVSEKKIENKLEQWVKIGAGSAIILVGAVMLFPSAFAGLGLSVTPGVGANGAQVTQSGGGCADTGLTNMNFKASYYDVGNSQDSLVNTTVNIYKSGENTAFVSSTTATSGYSTVGTVNCGTKGLSAQVGDHGVTYYEVEKTFDGLVSANTEVAISLKKAAAATATFSNLTTFGASTVGVTSGAGATVTDVIMKLKAGQYYYGDGSQEICAQFTQSNISKVSFTFNGASLPLIANDPSIAVTSGNLLNCYELAGDINNYVSKDLGVVIQAVSGVTPAYSNVTIVINDKASYTKNGKLLFGYFNADTNADVGLGKVTKTTAISVNPT